MILLIAGENEEEARKNFNLLQQGLRTQDRKHVKFVAGNGKNGFAKGQFGVTADANYKSTSDNFNAVQTIANDKQEAAVLSVDGPKDTFLSYIGAQQGQTVVIQSFSAVYGSDNYVSNKDALPGQTLFPLRGAPLANVIYSPLTSNNTEVHVANDQSDVEIVATMYHELAAHVVLSNIGRNIPQSGHVGPNAQVVNATAKAAEAEARQNFNQGAQPQRRKR